MSAEPKFTSGQWKADGRRIVCSGRGVIAECPLPKSGGVFECIANAHLIAAAPDLYEALRDVLDSLGALSNPSELESRMTAEEARRVWAALARAEGKTP